MTRTRFMNDAGRDDLLPVEEIIRRDRGLRLDPPTDADVRNGIIQVLTRPVDELLPEDDQETIEQVRARNADLARCVEDLTGPLVLVERATALVWTYRKEQGEEFLARNQKRLFGDAGDEKRFDERITRHERRKLDALQSLIEMFDVPKPTAA